MLTLLFFNSQATAASTVWFCVETECSSMTVTFGGVTHPKTLNCENMLSFDGASAGTYSYSVSGCGLTSSGSVTVDGTSSYYVTICPPSGWPCCPIGCGDSGDYKCSCSVPPVPAQYFVSSNGDCGTGVPCFKKIQDAVNNAPDGSEILVRQGIYEESISLTSAKTVTVKGGYDSEYSGQTANTTFIQGLGKTTIQASSGSLKYQMLSHTPSRRHLDRSGNRHGVCVGGRGLL